MGPVVAAVAVIRVFALGVRRVRVVAVVWIAVVSIAGVWEVAAVAVAAATGWRVPVGIGVASSTAGLPRVVTRISFGHRLILP